MNKFKICISIILSLIAYQLYQIIQNFDIFKENKIINNNKCYFYLPDIPAAEDIKTYKNIILLSSSDKVKLFALSTDLHDMPDGAIYAIYPSFNFEQMKANPTKIAKKLFIKNFPASIRFEPFGISIYNDYLYVINQAYDKGGERIEVIKLNKLNDQELELTYEKSLIFDKDFLGVVDNLLVLEKDKFFFSQWLAVGEHENGKQSKANFWNRLINELSLVLLLKKTYVWYCEPYPNSNNLNCQKQVNTASVLSNGLVFDSNNKRIVQAQTVEKQLVFYQIDMTKQEKLIPIKTIKLEDCPDNINYDNTKDQFLVGSTAKGFDFFKTLLKTKKQNNGKLAEDITYWGSVTQLKNNNDLDKITPNVIFKTNDQLIGITVAETHNDITFVGSWIDNKVLVCKFDF